MEIRYYSYSEELLQNLEPGKIHVFPKSVDKSLARSRYLEASSDIFEKQPKFMGLGEFKTNLFLTDEIVLREEKQVIAFYKSLSKKNKKELGAENYYDIIDVAANFLNFFKLLKEYRITNIDGLRKWQKKIYMLFLEIEKNYIKFLKIRNYTDPTFIIDDKNYTCEGLKGYSEIIFYNKLFFTPLEKWLIEKLEKDGFKVVLKLQMKEGDFCEKNYRLKSFSIENIDTISKENIEIYSVDDEFTELLKVIEIIETKEKKVEIFDANNENYKYNSFFNNKKYLSNLPVYSLLEGFHELLLNLEVIDDELALDLHSVVEIIKSKEIVRYYKITLEELESFGKIVGEGYKYLTKSEILGRKELGEESFIDRMYDHISKISHHTTLKKWMEELSYSSDLLEELLSNDKENIGKYFEALSEIEVIEELNLVDNWENFFVSHKKVAMEEIKKSEGLLRLILKYLKFKEINEVKNQKSRKTSLEELKTKKSDNLLFLNISDVYMPLNKEKTFLLTEQQKINLGIRSVEEIRLEEKYNLLRAIATAKQTQIIAIKNMDSNSSFSPFVEEIIEKLEIKTLYEENSEKKALEEEKPSIMGFELNELKVPQSISAYMCDELFRCRYKMYMRYIEKLDSDELEVDKNLTRREYGILAHELFEAVLERIEITKDYSPFVEGEINTDIIMGILKAFIRKRKLKLPMLNEKYYTEIIYKNLVKSVGVFFGKIAKELKNQEVEKLIIEEKLGKTLLSKLAKLEGNAKADLIIKTTTGDIIIDFKTGGLNERQLDFYSILYSGEAEKCRKYIFNVDKGELKESKVIKMTKEELVEELKEWIRSKKYDRTKNSQCTRCEYLEICRVGELEDE